MDALTPHSNTIDMTSSPLKIGFVGLGIMGAPMAGQLIKAGHQLFVFTRGKTPPAIATSSATKCLSARGVAERAETFLGDVADEIADIQPGIARAVEVEVEQPQPRAIHDHLRRVKVAVNPARLRRWPSNSA